MGYRFFRLLFIGGTGSGTCLFTTVDLRSTADVCTIEDSEGSNRTCIGRPKAPEAGRPENWG